VHLASSSAAGVARIARLRWLTPQVHAISTPVSTRHARRARRLASRPLFETILPPETRLTAYSPIRSLFRTFLCGLLVPLVPSLLLRIAYLSHIQSPLPSLGQAPNQRSLFPPVPLACLPPQALRSLRFPSARSHSFGNVAPNLTPSRVLGSLERSLAFIIYHYPSVFLNSRGEFLSSSQHLSEPARLPDQTDILGAVDWCPKVRRHRGDMRREIA